MEKRALSSLSMWNKSYIAILGLFLDLFHIYIKRILDCIIAYDPANTNSSLIHDTVRI